MKVATLKEIQRLLDVSKSTAWRYLSNLKFCKNKQKHSIVTIEEFIEFYQIQTNEKGII